MGVIPRGDALREDVALSARPLVKEDSRGVMLVIVGGCTLAVGAVAGRSGSGGGLLLRSS